MKKMKKVKECIKKALPYIMFMLPFSLMNLALIITAKDIFFVLETTTIPGFAFTFYWCLVLLFVVIMLGKVWGSVLYAILCMIHAILCLTHIICYSATGKFFTFKLLEMSGEGKGYIEGAIKSAPKSLWLYFIVVLVSIALGIYMILDERFVKPAKLFIVAFLVLVIPLHFVAKLDLGKTDKGSWNDAWQLPRGVYDSFQDTNKALIVSGLTEYTIRDIYFSFFKKSEVSEEEIACLDEIFKEEVIHSSNEHTGIYKGKNLILLQFEGLDSWLINDTDTPNIKRLMEEGMDFTNHYSYSIGGGSTFNSELCVNTGLIKPFTYNDGAMTYSSNYLPYTLAKLFKAEGYGEVNAYHMNTKEYYSRGINYENWGYDSYNGLIDRKGYNGTVPVEYQLDSNLLSPDNFGDEPINKNEPFVSEIITYTVHCDFTSSDVRVKELMEKFGLTEKPKGEEEVARLFAKETDSFVGLLMERLGEQGIYDNTVIVGYTDHFLVSLTDKSIVEGYKGEGYHKMKTPFFIWDSKGLLSGTEDKINSQTDILPTVLNLFGISYNEKWYTGNDIFDEKYIGYVLFPEMLGLTNEGLDYFTPEMEEKIKKNDYILKGDYYRIRLEESTKK